MFTVPLQRRLGQRTADNAPVCVALGHGSDGPGSDEALRRWASPCGEPRLASRAGDTVAVCVSEGASVIVERRTRSVEVGCLHRTAAHAGIVNVYIWASGGLVRDFDAQRHWLLRFKQGGCAWRRWGLRGMIFKSLLQVGNRYSVPARGSRCVRRH